MNKIKIIYEIFMLILIIISLIGLFYSNHYIFNIIHRTIYCIFLIDLITRLTCSISKWKYIKKHPFDIISILPLEEFLLLARFARFFKFFRYKTLLKRYLIIIHKQVSKISLKYVTLGIILLYFILIILFPLTFITLHLINFTAPIDQYPVFAVILKTIGVLYMGLLLNKISSLLMGVYKKYLKKEE